MKCKDCNADMEELFEENMAVLVRGYFVAKNGRRVFLYICPKCGRVQGELAADASQEAPKKNGRVVKYCQLLQLALLKRRYNEESLCDCGRQEFA